jgi:hypothetical protein
METTSNEIRERDALMKILDIQEHWCKSFAGLSEKLLGGFLSANVARSVIAIRCEETAKLIGEKL